MAKGTKGTKTVAPEGMERPAVLVTVLDGSQTMFRAFAWGDVPEAQVAFVLTNSSRVYFYGKTSYMIHFPAEGCTFDEDLKHRPLRREESVIMQ